MKRSRFKVVETLIICIMANGLVFAGIKESLVNFATARSGITRQASLAQPTLDSVSESCLGCHDESRASRIIVKNADAPLQILDGKTNNHPLGMIYDQYQGMSPGKFIQREALDPKIELVDGRVGCLSCHEMKDEELEKPQIPLANVPSGDSADCPSSNQLTVAGNRSALCISCHIK